MPENCTLNDLDDVSAAEDETLHGVYALLASTMRYPDPAFCNDTLFAALDSLLVSLDWQTELKAFRQWREESVDPLDELRTEYTRLFINSAPRTTVHPYASVYLDGDKCLQGRTTERTRDFYRQRGYDITRTTEPADHISIELDFLAALAGEGRHADQELFLRTLFRPWFQRFQEKVIQEARHPFFKVSLQLIDFFTKEEQ
ncbi:TorD/DmsD family molecular chaperone [Desulfobulbus alkaliphilus]|uniref:TorD/DmsD family molecular chaperone n=1 Tax=Desulfobulbus alkaliphilus TaxID=869814 RepID=UPI001963AB29|nr:molecular chaperone TorD family protein [Desulfobulbus alkaliphilus]MBM9536405.1 molecular chaperone TorD family protein [Desulfobulbus alkaliphilus]